LLTRAGEWQASVTEKKMIAAFNDLVQAHPLNSLLVAICCVGIVLIRQKQRQLLAARRRDERKSPYRQ
jgi:hypothetical protein